MLNKQVANDRFKHFFGVSKDFNAIVVIKKWKLSQDNVDDLAKTFHQGERQHLVLLLYSIKDPSGSP